MKMVMKRITVKRDDLGYLNEIQQAATIEQHESCAVFDSSDAWYGINYSKTGFKIYLH